jgi:hypothetical protein
VLALGSHPIFCGRRNYRQCAHSLLSFFNIVVAAFFT